MAKAKVTREKLSTKQNAAKAMDALSDGRDLIVFLTCVTEHSDCDSSRNGRAAILEHAIRHLIEAEKSIDAIHKSEAKKEAQS